MNKKAKKILIVEDEETLREILKELVTENNLACTEASNGKEGLALARATAFDLIITDILMPEMTGLQMLEELRNSGILTPVLIISGFGDEQKIRKAWNLGAFDFVDKPFDSDQLASLIRNALEFGPAQTQQWSNVQMNKKKGAA